MKTFTVRHCPFFKSEKSQGPDQIKFRKIEDVFENFTAGCVEIFLAIAGHRPESTEQVIDMLATEKRDQQSLHADMTALADFGLVRFVRMTSTGEEDVYKPVAKFDRIVFEFIPELYRNFERTMRHDD